ncbi:MAG: hypothetical protein NC390_04890 [Fusobacterium sp.]|nr:hypothetical protein [Fusobacterium sp.]
MAVELEVGKPIDNNRVEVRATYNGASRRNFSVQQDKSDEFVSSYKKLYNKASIISTLGMCVLGGLGGVAGGQLAKNASNSWVRWGAVIAGGLAGYISAIFASAKPIQNAEKNMLNKFGAEEITKTS